MELFVEIRGGDKPGFLRELVERGTAGVLFVGDTQYDRQAAEQAGVAFVMVAGDGDLKNLGARLRAEAGRGSGRRSGAQKGFEGSLGSSSSGSS
jgi:hypothetical protein